MIPESDSEFTLARASLTTVTHSLTLALCQGQPLCTLTLPCNILPAAGQPSQSICSARASQGTDCKQLVKRLSPTQSAVSLCGTTITHMCVWTRQRFVGWGRAYTHRPSSRFIAVGPVRTLVPVTSCTDHACVSAERNHFWCHLWLLPQLKIWRTAKQRNTRGSLPQLSASLLCCWRA